MDELVSGTYWVTWWNTLSGTVFLTQTVPVSGDALTMTLPTPFATDVALQFACLSDQARRVYLPLVLK